MIEHGQIKLHPRLAADTHHLGRFGPIQLLLHRNASLHWFMLVPLTQAFDLTDLGTHERQTLLDHAACIGQLLKGPLKYPRVNVGALGMLVPQLHLHVIGRREDDPCWPNPVWGSLPDGGAYETADLADLQTLLAETAIGYQPRPVSMR